MKQISQILSMLLPVIYLIVVFIYAHIFFKRNKNLENKIPLMIILLIIIHTAQLILRGMAIGTLPLVTKFDALSLLAYAIVILIMIIEFSSENKITIFFCRHIIFYYSGYFFHILQLAGDSESVACKPVISGSCYPGNLGLFSHIHISALCLIVYNA